jgi:hypothetical protein
MLALNVVAFVVRIIDRGRLTHNRSIPSEGSVSVAHRSIGDIEASTKAGETRIGIADSARSVLATAGTSTYGTERVGGRSVGELPSILPSGEMTQ